ncbi:hypothetical protein [Sphingomonas sp. S-NIH.Pt15_0812]|nr:hypothetical protein [Sphingomonas sp. S-NIH.Pt15_0812]
MAVVDVAFEDEIMPLLYLLALEPVPACRGSSCHDAPVIDKS